MEVNQADQVTFQKQQLMCKWYACSLGMAKLVYAQDEDQLLFEICILR